MPFNSAVSGLNDTFQDLTHRPGEPNFQIKPIGKAIVGDDLILTKIALYGQKTKSWEIFQWASGPSVSEEIEFGQAGK